MSCNFFDPFDNFLKKIADKTVSVSNLRLHILSDLSESEILLFKKIWHSIDLERRRELFDLIIKFSEDEFYTDLTRIFITLAEDTDKNIRIRSLIYLSKSENPEAAIFLLNTLENDRDNLIRITAADALANFVLLGEIGKIKENLYQKIKDILFRTYNNENEPEELRGKVLSSLGYGSDYAIDISNLITIAYNGTSKVLKRAAVLAMGRNYNEKFLDIIILQMSSNDPEMKLNAIMAAAEMENKKTIPTLSKLVYDENPIIHKAAMIALVAIGDKKCIKIVEECEKSDIESIRTSAKEVLKSVFYV